MALPLSVAVLVHGGIERSEQPTDPANIEANLLLRVQTRSINNSQSFTLNFHGRWALLLATLEPKDVLTITGASQDDRGDWHVNRETDAITQIVRDDHSVTLDSAAVQAANVPQWLKLPTTRPIHGCYQYSRYLITLRDSVESNLFAVVLENAKPGPASYGYNVGTNIVVVDRSFDNMPVRSWNTQDEIPKFSIQLSMTQISVEALPFLCAGDVIRCHRFRVAARPKRYLNIRQCKFSSVIVFPIAGSSPEAAATLPYTPVTTATEHTVLDSDRDHARVLHKWIRGRMGAETVSDYLADIRDLHRSNAHRDIIAKVLRVLPDVQILVVSDGSTNDPIQVRAAEPFPASQWLFAHVKPDMWIKMRNVSPCDGSLSDSAVDDCELECMCSQVTLMPHWCYDVRVRANRMTSQISSGAQPEGGQISQIPLGDDPHASSHQPRQRHEDTLPNTSGDTEIDEDVERQRSAIADLATPVSRPTSVGSVSGSSRTMSNTQDVASEQRSDTLERPLVEGSQVVVFGLRTQPELNGRRGTLCKLVANGTRWQLTFDGQATQFNVKIANIKAAPGTDLQASVEPVRSTPEPLPVRLTTSYGSQSGIRIHELRAAWDNGEPAVVIGGFGVAGAEHWARHHVLFTRCKVCNAGFPWERGDVYEAKRRRDTLPCGHWLFDLVFEVKLELWDIEDQTQRVTVSVRDESAHFFGISPQGAARDAAELKRVYALLQSLARTRELNKMTVSLASYPTLVACETSIV